VFKIKKIYVFKETSKFQYLVRLLSFFYLLQGRYITLNSVCKILSFLFIIFIKRCLAI